MTHYDVPGRITSLKLLRDGELYLSTTKGIFRMNREKVVDVIAEEYAPIEQQQNIWVPVDMALTGAGDLWVTGQLALLQFGRNQSTVHELIANKAVAAPDDSVWVLGWDGIADNGCCYYHVQEDEIRAYKFADPLPVSSELEQQIRAMQQ
ncbi:MAG: hypothetical protein KC419_16065 [Anaerolineales bacterium]|nr:hypothetical protein [Anaerolineales bacterium]